MTTYSTLGDDPHDETEKDQKSGVRPELRATIRRTIAEIAAVNERAKDERNARRWKNERDPVEYEKQKEKQRAKYAVMVEVEEGRVVRDYQKVPGKTKAERAENRRKRDAERKRKSRALSTQEAKDREADRKWARRQRKAGKSEAEIKAGLERRRADRRNSYQNNPIFGAF